MDSAIEMTELNESPKFPRHRLIPGIVIVYFFSVTHSSQTLSALLGKIIVMVRYVIPYHYFVYHNHVLV